MSDTVTVTEKEDDMKEQKDDNRSESQKKAEKEAETLIRSERQALEFIKEKVEEYKTIDNQMAQMIRELAYKIEVLPGIAKDTVASIIANGFRRLKVQTVHISYVYQVLGPEYKNAVFSKMSRENNLRRMRLGYDPKTGDYILSLNDVNDAKITQYSKNTLLNIIHWYKEEVGKLQEENDTLRRELKVLAAAR